MTGNKLAGAFRLSFNFKELAGNTGYKFGTPFYTKDKEKIKKLEPEVKKQYEEENKGPDGKGRIRWLVYEPEKIQNGECWHICYVVSPGNWEQVVHEYRILDGKNSYEFIIYYNNKDENFWEKEGQDVRDIVDTFTI